MRIDDSPALGWPAGLSCSDIRPVASEHFTAAHQPQSSTKLARTTHRHSSRMERNRLEAQPKATVESPRDFSRPGTQSTLAPNKQWSVHIASARAADAKATRVERRLGHQEHEIEARFAHFGAGENLESQGCREGKSRDSKCVGVGWSVIDSQWIATRIGRLKLSAWSATRLESNRRISATQGDCGAAEATRLISRSGDAQLSARAATVNEFRRFWPTLLHVFATSRLLIAINSNADNNYELRNSTRHQPQIRDSKIRSTRLHNAMQQSNEPTRVKATATSDGLRWVVCTILVTSRITTAAARFEPGGWAEWRRKLVRTTSATR